MSLQVKLLHPHARPPQRTRALDAGYDLYCLEPFTLAPGERRVIDTGIAIALPEDTAGLVLPRSGLAAKHGITVVNSPGLIDPSYRGEVKVIMLNTDSEEPFVVEGQERIAQLLLVRFSGPQPEVVGELPESADERGEAGLGSSGGA